MSDVLGVGIDLCTIARMERAMQKPRFTQRVFTPQERDYLVSRGRGGAQSAAAMFAAKEAVAKALGTGFGRGIMPDQIEVTHDGAGAPGVCLTGEAAQRMVQLGGGHVLLSLTHEGEQAAAFAVLCAEEVRKQKEEHNA